MLPAYLTVRTTNTRASLRARALCRRRPIGLPTRAVTMRRCSRRQRLRCEGCTVRKGFAFVVSKQYLTITWRCCWIMRPEERRACKSYLRAVTNALPKRLVRSIRRFRAIWPIGCRSMPSWCVTRVWVKAHSYTRSCSRLLQRFPRWTACFCLKLHGGSSSRKARPST